MNTSKQQVVTTTYLYNHYIKTNQLDQFPILIFDIKDVDKNPSEWTLMDMITKSFSRIGCFDSGEIVIGRKDYFKMCKEALLKTQ